MIISDFYEGRWKNIRCRKDYENSKEKLDYLRTEYELWARWIDEFYSGKHGIFKTLTGDAPRYALEDYMDFCYWEKTYKKNYPKRDHFANHKVRAEYIIKLLTKLFNDVDNYVLRSYTNADDIDNDEGFNLNFEEMKENMKKDRTYKEKWFKAAHDANDYIENIFMWDSVLNTPQTTKIYQKMQRGNILNRKILKSKNLRSKKRSRSKNLRSKKRSRSKNLRSQKKSKSKKKRNRY